MFRWSGGVLPPFGPPLPQALQWRARHAATGARAPRRFAIARKPSCSPAGRRNPSHGLQVIAVPAGNSAAFGRRAAGPQSHAVPDELAMAALAMDEALTDRDPFASLERTASLLCSSGKRNRR